MKLGVTNFRVFKTRQEFSIKPITLLTGPNNAGKSAFTKLLELLKLGIAPLRFGEGRHNLVDFPNAVNWESDEKYFEISFDSNIEYFYPNVRTNLRFEDGKVMDMSVNHGSENIFSVKLPSKELTESEHRRFRKEGIGSYTNYELNFNYKKIIDSFVDKKILIKDKWDGKKILYKELKNYRNIPENINYENYKDHDHLGNDDIKTIQHTEDVGEYRSSTLVVRSDYFLSVYLLNNALNEISETEKYVLFDIYINGENRTHEFIELIVEIQDKFFTNYCYRSVIDIDNIDFKETLEFVQRQLLSPVRKEILERLHILGYSQSNEDTKIIESKIHKILFEEKFIGWKFLRPQSGSTFFQQFTDQLQNIENQLQNVDFISSQRGTIERVLQTNSNHEMNKMLVEFSNSGHNTFINKAFEIFGIKGNLEITTYENTIMVPSINLDGKKTAFPDLGFGFSQIIPYIIKIATAKGNDDEFSMINTILIIEEPEANLHPNLQSKLADFFVLAVQTFPNIRLIIETHSEYIIRKLQYLTAKKDLDTDATQIYYFNADEFVNEHEPKVKSININQNGTLTEDFGPGFYDEAIRLRFDLMKLNSEQLN